MKVKEINRTANMAWSPAEQHPIYVATGTAAQQLDATFSTSAALEIFSLDLAKDGVEMEQVASLNTQHRFHTLVWGKHGMGNGTLANGTVIGGTDNGGIYVYSAEKLLAGEDGLITKMEDHTGAVRALDINPFQANLLSSGASDSEIFIWDLNNSGTPMTPGAKSQPPDEISCVAWNRQVQHILASTCPGGRCVVWDLRKNEPIIKVTDHSSRIRCKAVAWHPEVATQMVLASEDDHSPVIQMWDLRFATSPLKVLENHQRGVLSIAWCPQDPDLLLSCGKDNRILCWNPNSPLPGGEVVYELPTSSQWSFDVQWCPRNPGLISSSSFDGHISVYSLLGGGGMQNGPRQQQVDKIASSFPGTDGFNQPAPQTQAPAEPVILKKPPKWLRTPVGATFGFGGKLITFTSPKMPSQQQQQQTAPVSRPVHISQVVTETDLINRSNSLEDALSRGSFTEFCNGKIKQSHSELDTQIWKFLKVNFEKEPRSHFVSLLGHDAHELARKAAVATGATLGLTNGSLEGEGGVDAEELAERMQRLSSGGLEKEAKLGSGSKTPNDMLGDGDGAAAFDAISAAGPVEVENRAQSEDSRAASPFTISQEDDTNGLVSQAILTGKFDIAVELCLHDNRMADAILLAIAGGPELLAKTQRKYFQKSKSDVSRLISSVVTKDVTDIIQNTELENWKEALTALLTYSSPKEFSSLCDALGQRLETEGNGKMAPQACLCYICSGNVDKLVSCWAQVNHSPNSPLSLQDLVEKVVILRKAIELKLGYTPEIQSPILATRLTEYAHLLASQGNLATAMNYLGQSQESKILELRDRLYKAQGSDAATQSPWKQMNVAAQPAQPASTLGTNSFQTTTVSSSSFYNSQVSSRAQKTAYGSQAYARGQQQQPQQPGQGQQSTGQAGYTATQTSAAGGVSSAQSPMRASMGGPRHYPSYPQTGMQQYYAGTSATAGAAGQYGSQQPDQTSSSYGQPHQFYGQSNVPTTGQPTGNFYNPMDYSAQNPAISQAAPTPGLSGYSAPQPTQPVSTPSSMYSAPQPSGGQGVEVNDPSRAWNDPPVLKPKAQPTAYVPPQPITAPIAGVPAEEQQPTAQPYGGGPQPVGYQQRPPQQQPQYAPPQPKVQQETAPAQPAKEKPKAPIPGEHQVLCDTFNSLAQRCSASPSVNAQMKRKLDDVHKKLEVLYDKLREGKVSAMILQGLHEIAQAISAYNYQHGLAVHTRLVTSGNFSEISAFMPGLKVLMQLATQLRV
ncbi:protein transport protein Sec31A-like [Diadema setosum]|uniref:protein transport protein Sec31A-like n=1 Tax=Diadema setosum TaxID=31175 RepID=UPI003B39FDFC